MSMFLSLLDFKSIHNNKMCNYPSQAHRIFSLYMEMTILSDKSQNARIFMIKNYDIPMKAYCIYNSS